MAKNGVEREKNMKKSLGLEESQEIVAQIKDILDDVVNPIAKVVEIEDDVVEKKYEDCGCATCKAEDVSCDDCSKCSQDEEKMSKRYESDNEDEDKWNNMEKACWSGYKQVGMKDKGGRKVPNCVPVKKSLFGTEGPQTLIPRNK